MKRFRPVCVLLVAWLPLCGLSQDQPLTDLRFDILGVQLTVDPPVLTVPKGIATSIDTALRVPEAEERAAAQAIRAMTAGSVVVAELRGPSTPAIEIRVRPGEPIPIPPLNLLGQYFLDRIRLEVDGETVLEASPNVVPITVIDDILVTEVTARPLTLEEIQGKGIVIDDDNFDYYNFQLVFNIDGGQFAIDMPVALPDRDLPGFERADREYIEFLARTNRELIERTPVELPPELERAGLNLAIAPIPFVDADPQGGEGRPFGAPPITGLIVIPGNVGFLNQFFSVQLVVMNSAPDGTPLVVRDVTASITLPPGADRVPGTPATPGDDPLRLAEVEGIGVLPVIDIVRPGADGALGTADDVARLRPQETGEGEFLVEGRKEGFHSMDFEIHATLEGLPSGPVEIMGAAVGAVLVRNPKFSISLSHPDTIRAGENYDLYATVMNTSETVANLVSINLNPGGITGARLVSDGAVVFNTLPPGESGTARFTLVAQETGQITAAALNTEDGLTGAFRLTTGIGERGITLSPTSIILPNTVSHLPGDLVAAAQRVLGQALSIASSPAGVLPPDVRYVSRSTIVARGQALGAAGQRVALGDSLERVAADLLLDWLGQGDSRPGFDPLLRETSAGEAFFAALANVFHGQAAGSSILGLQQAYAETTVFREGPLTVAVGDNDGGAPVRLEVFDADGLVSGRTAMGNVLELIEGGLLPLVDDGGRADLLVLASAPSPAYRLRLTGTGTGVFDLGITLPPRNGTMDHVTFDDVYIAPGQIAELVFDPTGQAAYELRIDRDGNGIGEDIVSGLVAPVSDGPPRVLAIRQIESSRFASYGDPYDPATYGLMVAVLFDQPMDPATTEDPSRYDLEANTVKGAALQAGQRFAYLLLDKPIGTLTERDLTLGGMEDPRGDAVAGTTQTVDTVLGEGAHVLGQVRNADGTPVADGVLLIKIIYTEIFVVTVAIIHTDSEGGFDFDFIPRLGRGFMIVTQHPETQDTTSVRSVVRGPGQQIVLFPTFLGKGSVRGTVYQDDGETAIPGAPVFLAGTEAAAVNANDAGDFLFDDLPVGPFTVRSFDGSGGFGQSSGVIESAGDEPVVDVVLIHHERDTGTLGGRVFLPDGITPAEGYTVYYGSYDRRGPTLLAVDQTESDASGSFDFGAVLPGGYDVVAMAPQTGAFGVTEGQPVFMGVHTTVAVVMPSRGAVEGVVFDARGIPAKGVLLAGGSDLQTTDVNGFFRIEDLDEGPVKIQAGDPVTKRQGSVSIDVVAGETNTVAITLEARASIVGRVYDAAGNPVPRATVRIPRKLGYQFVFANNDGYFRFTDLPLGTHLLQAPGPAQEGLIKLMRRKGINPLLAFTADPPDLPPELGGTGPPPARTENAVLDALSEAMETALNVTEDFFAGPPPPPAGGFGWTKVTLQQDGVVVNADVHYLDQGTVAGTTVDENSLPVAAQVRISALTVLDTGSPQFKEYTRATTPLDTGAFSFSGIPHFDANTFLNTGIEGGRYTVEAVATLQPGRPSHTGQLSAANPNDTDVELRFVDIGNEGTISGYVYMPDGLTPAPSNSLVTINFGTGLDVRTDETGYFENLFPIPKGGYLVTAVDPISGFQGVTGTEVAPGTNVMVEIVLQGLGDIRVRVERPDGSVVTNAQVEVQGIEYPRHTATGPVDGAGQVVLAGLSEGDYSVMAEEGGTGLKGRASGMLLRDLTLELTVVVRGSGTVQGTFVSNDGLSPIANAEVRLQAGGVTAFAVTDSNGVFQIDAVPMGRFSMTASDPLTGREGLASGTLAFQNQVITLTLTPVPRGRVTGQVVEADGATPVPGALVQLGLIQVNTRQDGSFAFEAVPAGDFSVRARDPVTSRVGTATGALSTEGEDVQVTVSLAGYGTVDALVLNPDGTTNQNASVSAGGRTGVTDANGMVRFEKLPLGTYVVRATSLSEPHSRAEGSATLTDHLDTDRVTILLPGVGEVDVTVFAADGVSTVASAEVDLYASGTVAGGRPGLGADSYQAFTDGNGRTDFQDVAVGRFHVSAKSGPLTGVATGQVATAGDSASVNVILGGSGSVTGRVLLADGQTPAIDTFVTLTFAGGVLQITTDLTGIFNFDGVPMGGFTIEVFDPFTFGVARPGGAVMAEGEVVNLGDVVLDNTAPFVVAVTPAAGASGVPLDTDIAITFDESMDASSLQQKFKLWHAGVEVPTTLSTSDSNRTVTLHPVLDLESDVAYRVTVAGPPNGPRNRVGLMIGDRFTATFRTADTIPPTVVSISPTTGRQQVDPGAVVRVTFSETMQTGFDFVVEDSARQPVVGAVAMALGDTVAIFTPADFLAANELYTVHLSNVIDRAGNPLVGSPYASTFATVDSIPPRITGLQVVGSTIEGSTVQVTPIMADTDVVSVTIVEAGGDTTTAADPFVVPVRLSVGATQVDLTVTALDDVGNRSQPFEEQIAIQPDLPPMVTLVGVPADTHVTRNQSIPLDIHATDDVGIAEVRYTVVGAVSDAQTFVSTNLPTATTNQVNLVVPSNAGSLGRFTLQAVAIDSVGRVSDPATAGFTILDTVAPTLSFERPVNQAVILPGQTIEVAVTATDDASLGAVTLECPAGLVGCDTVVLPPGVTETTRLFQLTVSPTALAPATYDIVAHAEDAAGNAVGPVTRTVVLADTEPPVVTLVESLTGSRRATQGQTVTVRAHAQDNMLIAGMVFEVSGEANDTAVVPTAPSLAVVEDYPFTVPGSAADGALIQAGARAVDASGNTGSLVSIAFTIGDLEPPSITAFTPAPSLAVEAGEVVPISITATDDVAVAELRISATGLAETNRLATLAPPSTPATLLTPLSIPADAGTGEIAITATVVDAAGKTSSLNRVVQVVDRTAPAVAITDPAPGAIIDPRIALPVTVEATDRIGVDSIRLTASGVQGFSETRVLTPPMTSHNEQFTIVISSPPVAGGALHLDAVADDESGNLGRSARVTVQVQDVVPPVVTAFNPTNGATQVATETILQATFFEPMDPATAVAGNLVLEEVGGAEQTVQASLSPNGTTLSVTPEDGLLPGVLYRLTLSSNLTDLAGLRLAETSSVFTTMLDEIFSFHPDLLSVTEGTSRPWDVALSAPAPAGGLELTLTIDDPGIASIPATVVIPAGATNMAFQVDALVPGFTPVVASAPGVRGATGIVQVLSFANRPPIAADDATETLEELPVSVAVLPNDQDPDGDLISIASFSQPTNGTVVRMGDRFEYRPALDFDGTDAFTYRVTDGQLESGDATVTVTVAPSDDFHWTNTAGGAWSDGTNWDRGRPPGPTDKAIIDAAGTYSVMLNTAETVAQLFLGATGGGTQTLVNTASTTISHGGAVTASGVLRLVNGTPELRQPLTSLGRIVWSGGTLTGGGELVNRGDMELASNFQDLNGLALRNAGTSTVTGGGRLEFLNAARIINEAGARWDFTGNPELRWIGGSAPAFENHGTLRKTGGGTGQTLMNVPLVSDGALEIQTGSLGFDRNTTISGTVMAVAGAEIRHHSDTINYTATSVVSGDGGFRVTGGTVNMGGTLATTGPLITDGGTLNLQNLYTIPATWELNGGATELFDTNLLVRATPVTAAGALLMNGPFEAPALTVIGGYGNSATTTVHGAMTWNNGVISRPGTTVVEGVLTIPSNFQDLSEHTLVCAGGGTFNGNNRIEFFNGASIVNPPGATFDLTGNAELRWVGGAQPTFINQGVLRKTGGTGESLVNVVLENAGAVEVQTGTLRFTRDGFSTGSMAVAAGAVLQHAASYTHQAGSSLSGPGAFRVTGGAVSVNGAYGITGPLEPNGGTLNINTAAPLSFPALTVGSGLSFAGNVTVDELIVQAALTVSSTVTVTTTFNWTDGALSGGGELISQGTMTIASNFQDLNGLTLRNAGTSTVTGGGRLEFLNAARIINEAGARWDFTGNPELRWIGGSAPAFENHGTLRKTGGGTGQTLMNVPLVSDGAIEIQTGSLGFDRNTTISGTVMAVAGAEVRHPSDTINYTATSVVSGDGGFRVTGGTVNMGGTLATTGPLITDGGTLNLQNLYTIPATWELNGGATELFDTNLLVRATPVTAAGALLMNGPFEAPALTVIGGYGNSATTTVHGAMTWNNGVISRPGTTVVEGVLTIPSNFQDLSEHTLVCAGGGALNGNNRIEFFNGASIVNPPGATFDLTGNAELRWSGGAQPTFINQGVLRKTGGTGESLVNVVLENAGAVEVQTGTLRFSRDGFSTGSLTVAAGAVLQHSASYTHRAGSSLSGPGAFRVTGGTVSVNGTYGVTGPLEPNGGTLHINTAAPLSFPALTVGSGLSFAGNVTVDELIVQAALTVSSTVTVTTTFNWTGGALSGGGELISQGTMTIALNSQDLNGLTLRNAGTATVTGGGRIEFLNAARVVNEAGTLWRLPVNAEMRWVGGAAPVFVNHGELRRDTATGTFQFNIPLENHGLIDVQTGTLRMQRSYIQVGGESRVNGSIIRSDQTMDVQGGSLAGTGVFDASVDSDGTLSAGPSVGALEIVGDFNQGTNHSTVIEINGADPVNTDVLNIGQTANLDGVIQVNFVDGFVPAAGQSWQPIRWQSVSGTFASTNITGLGAGQALTFGYGSTGLVLNVVGGGGGAVQGAFQSLDPNPAGGVAGARGDSEVAAQSVSLTWTDLPGQSYRVEYTVDMVTWQSVPALIVEVEPGRYFAFATHPPGSSVTSYRFVRE